MQEKKTFTANSMASWEGKGLVLGDNPSPLEKTHLKGSKQIIGGMALLKELLPTESKVYGKEMSCKAKVLCSREKKEGHLDLKQ